MKVPLVNRHGDVVDYAIVDDADAWIADQGPWVKSANGYAVRSIGCDSSLVTIRMHRRLLGLPDRVIAGVIVDHVNGNGLDNRRANIRLATSSTNGMNARSWKNNKSGHRGVGRHRQCNRWYAEIKVNQKKKYLGLFRSKAEAVAARQNAERIYFGEFANKGT